MAGAGDAVFLAVPADPAVLPSGCGALVRTDNSPAAPAEAAVQAAEHADADHELLQLLLVPLVVLDH